MARKQHGSGDGVRLFPRRKHADGGAVQCTKGRPPVFLEYERISVLFGTPQAQAAETLEISITSLKQVCRKLGITRWPYARRSTKLRRSSARPINDLSAAPAQPANFHGVAVASESDECSVSGVSYAETAYSRSNSFVSTCSSEDGVDDSSDGTDDLAWLIGASVCNAFDNNRGTEVEVAWLNYLALNMQH
jgi:hypothetical protein